MTLALHILFHPPFIVPPDVYAQLEVRQLCGSLLGGRAVSLGIQHNTCGSTHHLQSPSSFHGRDLPVPAAERLSVLRLNLRFIVNGRGRPLEFILAQPCLVSTSPSASNCIHHLVSTLHSP
jgi:hypothetical protein